MLMTSSPVIINSFKAIQKDKVVVLVHFTVAHSPVEKVTFFYFKYWYLSLYFVNTTFVKVCILAAQKRCPVLSSSHLYFPFPRVLVFFSKLFLCICSTHWGAYARLKIIFKLSKSKLKQRHLENAFVTERPIIHAVYVGETPKEYAVAHFLTKHLCRRMSLWEGAISRTRVILLLVRQPAKTFKDLTTHLSSIGLDVKTQCIMVQFQPLP